MESACFIDADPQGSLTVSLGIKKPDDLSVSIATVMQDVLRTETPGRERIIHHEEGVDLLPSNIELSGLEVSLFNTMSLYILKGYLDTVKSKYDALIDCMLSLGMMTINALVAADSVLIHTAELSLPRV